MTWAIGSTGTSPQFARRFAIDLSDKKQAWATCSTARAVPEPRRPDGGGQRELQGGEVERVAQRGHPPRAGVGADGGEAAAAGERLQRRDEERDGRVVVPAMTTSKGEVDEDEETC